MAKAGRKKMRASERRDIEVRVMVTRSEKEIIRKAARSGIAGGGMSDWARAVLLDAAKRKAAVGVWFPSENGGSS